jgi:hypothetical protein
MLHSPIRRVGMIIGIEKIHQMSIIWKKGDLVMVHPMKHNYN